MRPTPTDLPAGFINLWKDPSTKVARRAFALLRGQAAGDLYLNRNGVRSRVPYKISERKAVNAAVDLLRGRRT